MKKITAVIVGALVWIILLPLTGFLIMLAISLPGTKIGFFIFGYAASFTATFFASLTMSKINMELTKDLKFIFIGLIAFIWLGGGLLMTLESPDIAFKISSTIGSLFSIFVLRNMSGVK